MSVRAGGYNQCQKFSKPTYFFSSTSNDTKSQENEADVYFLLIQTTFFKSMSSLRPTSSSKKFTKIIY